MTDETFSKACERLEAVVARQTSDPLAGLRCRSLTAAQMVLTIQGIEDPTYGQMVAAIETGDPSLQGVQR